MVHHDKEQIKTIARAALEHDGPLAAARFLAQTLFIGIRELGDGAYYGHLERVAGGIANEHIKPIGYLHDLVEDIDGWEFEDLEEIGFDDFIMEGLRAVTKDDDDPYFDEMVSIGQVPQAIPVKLSDLRDNTNILRLGHIPQEKDIERLRKYFLAWNYLNDIQQKRTAPGTLFTKWMKDQPEQKQDWGLARKYSTEPMPPENHSANNGAENNLARQFRP